MAEDKKATAAVDAPEKGVSQKLKDEAKAILKKEGKYRPRATVKFKYNGKDRHHNEGDIEDVQERQADAFVKVGYGEIMK